MAVWALCEWKLIRDEADGVFNSFDPLDVGGSSGEEVAELREEVV